MINNRQWCIPFQHDANAVICDAELSAQLKSATYSALKRMVGESEDDVPVLMSGAGHDAMAMSHLTKVCGSSISKSLFEDKSREHISFLQGRKITKTLQNHP